MQQAGPTDAHEYLQALRSLPVGASDGPEQRHSNAAVFQDSPIGDGERACDGVQALRS